MDLRTAETIIELDERVNLATNQFYNSAPAGAVHDPKLGQVFGDIVLSVKDLILTAILTKVHVLVTGPTGRGKTDLVKLICQGIFGNDGWFLLRLNPHLTEETFANIDMERLSRGKLRDAVSPAPFLSFPCVVLDEVNRTPAALTNILLGFCDGRIELKCGLKYDVGYRYRGRQGQEHRYHFIVGTMNEGSEYAGIFELDPALRRRFTLEIPFDDLRATPEDLLNIVENRTGPAQAIDYCNMVKHVAQACDDIIRLSLDPFALIYLTYLGNVGRCPHSRTGFHPLRATQELCSKAECRIQKIADSFCPSVGGFSEGLLIFLKRAACGLAALRIARTVQAIRGAFEAEDNNQIIKLAKLLDVQTTQSRLCDALVHKYLSGVQVTAGDVRELLPFVAIGGKVWIAEEYVTKHFAGSRLLAMREYGRLTYGGIENFFRQHKTIIEKLDDDGNGAIEKLKQRLEHAERFNDPYIRHTIEPLLTRYSTRTRGPAEIGEEIEATEPVRDSARQLVQ